MLRNFRPDAQVNGVAATVIFGTLATLAFKKGHKTAGFASTALATVSALYSALLLPQAQGLRDQFANISGISQFNALLFNRTKPRQETTATTTATATIKPKC